MKRMKKGTSQINMSHTNNSKKVNTDKEYRNFIDVIQAPSNLSQKAQNKTKITDTKGKEVKANLTKDNKHGKGKKRNGVPRPKTGAGKRVDIKDEHMFDKKITF